MTVAVQDELFPTTPQGAEPPSAARMPACVEASSPRPAVIRLGRDPHGRFTSAPEDTADEITAAVHADHLPNRVESRALIREAVHEVARRHGGRVHIAWVRPLVPTYARGPQLGASLRIWTRAGLLVPTGEFLPNGDPSTKARNAAKPAPVKRLVREIPPTA